MKQNNTLKLTNIQLKGFKSIDEEGQDIPIQDITILLGANGSGKSNLISFFKMLNYIMTGALQTYIGDSGWADSLLYYGSKKTPRLTAAISFANTEDTDRYQFSLAHTVGDTLIFTEETLLWHQHDKEKARTIQLAPGVRESELFNLWKERKDKTASIIAELLRGCRVFQFHDTSKEAKIRNSGYIEDGAFLRSDGGNLAAFLYAMKQQKKHVPYYQRIVRYIQMVMPQFKDFVLEPSARNSNYIFLNWLEKNSEYLFGPHQISDGSLRFMALAALLLQPPTTLPKVIVLDEPELGLHPFAISVLADMIRATSLQSQIILATQSTRFVDEFEAKDLVIVERDAKANCSRYRKLDEGKLSAWLNEYSMSELWEKNVLGGRP